jgi:hypothetical protein
LVRDEWGVTNGIIADPCAFTSVCGIGVWAYGAWRMWTRSGRMTWHMTTLDTDVPKRGEVPGLELIDEDVGSSKGVGCN